jgi:hypothetical protein
MLGAICNKLDYAAAVALVSVFIAVAWIAYALCFVTAIWRTRMSDRINEPSRGMSPEPLRRRRRQKAFIIGVSLAIVWVVTIAIMWAVLTGQPAQVERHRSHLWLFPLR